MINRYLIAIYCNINLKILYGFELTDSAKEIIHHHFTSIFSCKHVHFFLMLAPAVDPAVDPQILLWIVDPAVDLLWVLAFQ